MNIANQPPRDKPPASIPIDPQWWKDWIARWNVAPDWTEVDGSEPQTTPTRAAWQALYRAHPLLCRQLPNVNEPVPPRGNHRRAAEFAALAFDPECRRLLADIMRPFIRHEAIRLLKEELGPAIEYILDRRMQNAA